MIGEERQRLMLEIHDVYFIKNVRNEAKIGLRNALHIVRTLRPMNFYPDEMSLSQAIVSEGLEDTEEMRAAVMRGVEQTFEERLRNPDYLLSD